MCQKSCGSEIQFPLVFNNSEVLIEYDSENFDLENSENFHELPECSETECDQQMFSESKMVSKLHESIDQIENDLRQSSMSDFDEFEMSKISKLTNESINNLNNEFMKRLQFPILVRALLRGFKI